MKIRLTLSLLIGAAREAARLHTRALHCVLHDPAGPLGGHAARNAPHDGLPVAAVDPAGRRACGFFYTAAGDKGIAVVEPGGGTLTHLVSFPADDRPFRTAERPADQGRDPRLGRVQPPHGISAEHSRGGRHD